MCNSNENQSISKRIEVTNILLGKIAGQVANVSKEIYKSDASAGRRQREWSTTLQRIGDQYGKTQKVGLILMGIIMVVVSIAVSLLFHLILS